MALYLLSKQIDWAEVKDVVFQSNFLWLIPALFLYILSKAVSAFRLNILQRHIPINFDELQNLKLYFIGMFYNLFLPGGIGGDGYKGYYLKKKFETPLKPIISALFLDRFYGLAALFLLLFTGLLFTTIKQHVAPWIYWGIVALYILVIPVTWLIIKFIFPKFLPPFGKVLGFSLVVQGIQILEALCIIKAIGIASGWLNYLVLFLASSIAAVLPISVGGVGVRELTFVYGQELLNINKAEAVAFSLIFFVINAISSFIGAFLSMKD